VQWLVEVAGVDVSSTWGDYKHSALHALSTGWLSDEATVTQLIKTLIGLGANIKMTTSSGATVLHTAIFNAKSTVLEQLVTQCNSSSIRAQLIAHPRSGAHNTSCSNTDKTREMAAMPEEYTHEDTIELQ
jgi:ankyrin repeat protein